MGSLHGNQRRVVGNDDVAGSTIIMLVAEILDLLLAGCIQRKIKHQFFYRRPVESHQGRWNQKQTSQPYLAKANAVFIHWTILTWLSGKSSIRKRPQRLVLNGARLCRRPAAAASHCRADR